MKKDTGGSAIIWAIAAVMILTVIIIGSLTFASYSSNNSIINAKKIQLELDTKAAIDSVVTAIQQGKSLTTIIPDIGKTKALTITLPEQMSVIDEAYIKREEENRIIIVIQTNSTYGDNKAMAYMDYINKRWVLNHYEGGNPL